MEGYGPDRGTGGAGGWRASPGAGEGLDFPRARSRIGGLAWKTPLVPLDRGDGIPVAMKLESLQHTGSFKVRGAANWLLALTPRERAAGVVAASSGNHGRAVAEVARRLGVPATVCVPDWVDPSKLRDIRASGARVVSAGSSYDEAEERAETIAAKQGKPLVHPFDDLNVIEGQGTVGLEILEQFPDVEEVVVPLSGGGLVAGIGFALREHGVRIVAVSARRAAVMVRSIGYGRPTRFPDERTVASALSGGIGLDNRFTFAACNEVVSSHMTVGERDIENAIRRAFRECRLVVEGGGAVGLAALWSGRYRPRGRAVIVVSGSNIDPLLLASLLS